MPNSDAQPDACSVCGRTILAGEQTRDYITRDGERRAVCDLCRARAEAAGWIPAELAEVGLPQRERDGRVGRVRRLLERARETAAAVTGGAAGGEAVEVPAAGEAPAPKTLGPDEGPAPDPEPVARPEPPRPRPPLSPVRPPGAPGRGRRSIPQSPNRRIKRAFDSFNESDYRRTVAGLIRSLGPPRVSAMTSAASPAEVRITVAWELSWYQWEVDLAGDRLPVRELSKGDEVGQLDEEYRAWNAHATEDGELRLGAEGTDAAG